MYTQFFSLKQSPFSIAPDPRYLFMSERHREALAHLLYGVGSGGGFVLLTGEIGAGKTTVCRCFIEQIPANCKLAYIFNPKLSVEELLQSICDEFGIVLPDSAARPDGGAVSVKAYVDAINRHLLASHAQALNNVLIIDEAQNLSAEVLEQLRLLTNLETSERKLLQIILIGQPELRTMLARPELEQLAQRVIARYHLGSLTEAETGSYVEHRLAVAGATASHPFPRRLMRLVHQLAKGVPRRINLLCDRALLGAYVENQPQVTRAILRRAASEVFAGQDSAVASATTAVPRTALLVAAGVLAGVLVSGAAAWQWQRHGGETGRAALAPGLVSPSSMRHGAVAGKVAVAGVGAVSGAASATTVIANAAVLPSPSPSAAAVAAAPVAGGSDTPLRALAALWGQVLPEGEPCQVAASLNLRCLKTRGSLDELRQLDRPAVLTLHDDPVAPTYALLTAISDAGAALTINGKRQNVTLAALEARYDGDYTTFWRAPRAWRDEVSGGDHGPDVDWLARRLAQLYNLKKPQENQPLDAGLRRRLKQFQVANSLKADGVAGPKTFIRLNQLGGVQEPRLQQASGVAAVAGK